MLGNQIDNTCAVHIVYAQNDRGDFTVAELDTTDWGDRAVVVAVKVCGEDEGCSVLTVAPDESETLEEVHAAHTTEYAVEVAN